MCVLYIYTHTHTYIHTQHNTELNYKHSCFCPHFSWAELKDLKVRSHQTRMKKNKPQYSSVVERLNILSLLASFAHVIHYASWEGLLPGSSSLIAKCIPVFVKVQRLYIQLRVPTYIHNYFVLHCCFGFSASARNHGIARASSWLVNAVRISAKFLIFQLALFVRQTLNSRY